MSYELRATSYEPWAMGYGLSSYQLSDVIGVSLLYPVNGRPCSFPKVVVFVKTWTR